MAYRAALGGSPLGLINLRSSVPSGGTSTFNAGNSRNVNVTDYNNNMGKNHPGSLFTGKRNIRAWPLIKAINGSSDYDITGGQDVQYGSNVDNSSRKTLHNDSIYDTSVLNIIEKLSNTKAQLKPADFAYLKDIGVYPNNRLMIARRFASPAADNIMVKKKAEEVPALAVLMSWIPEDKDFLDISFGEEWIQAEADFKDVLNSLGADILITNQGGGMGSMFGAAGNIIPLPGFTEVFQRQFLAKLGLIEDSAKNMIPSGNPNLIKEAKMRKTVGYVDAGSGLTCKVNIKMVCEYELKHISGIDPTIVWMDLLGMILRFGTSESSTYGLSPKHGSILTKWLNNPNTLIVEVASKIRESIEGVITAVKEDVQKAYEKGYELAQNLDAEAAPTNTTDTEQPKKSPREIAYNKLESAKMDSLGIIDMIGGFFSTVTQEMVHKYRVRIMGIINSLTGLPSTPWHITIGNPMRPTFCSGDMLTTDVNLKLGPILMFNDLPSSITVEFTLTNARPWGLQEIMAKFNSGYLRTVDVQKTFYETNAFIKNGQRHMEGTGYIPFDKENNSVGVAPTLMPSSDANNASTSNTTNTNSNSVGVLNSKGETSVVDIFGTNQTRLNGDVKNQLLEYSRDANA